MDKLPGWRNGMAGVLLSSAALLACAGEARPAADDPVLEATMMDIASELRCLVCQNQTVADSHAGLAVDLRQQIREQLREGKSADDIRAFMTARYGDFVLYRPPFTATTALLWLGPGLLFVGSLAALGLTLRRRNRLDDQAFEADDAADDGHDVAPAEPNRITAP